MDPTDLNLQRLFDGQLSSAEAAALEHLIARDPARKQHAQHFQVMESLLKQRSNTVNAGFDRTLVAHAIMQRLPTATPTQVSSAISAMEFVAAGLVMTSVLFVAAMLRLFNDMAHIPAFPLWSAMALFVGLVMVLAAGPLRRAERSMMSKLLHRPLNTSAGDILTLRMAGVACAIGGYWLMSGV